MLEAKKLKKIRVTATENNKLSSKFTLSPTSIAVNYKLQVCGEICIKKMSSCRVVVIKITDLDR
jgi:predicted RNA-binding Zn-ribbon protein involved in translation (DUF1610 family)